ncbi:MAG TPA: hypothetical protein VK745_23540, partial [Polyangiaceae bacterium]|nr:hypothetical protein [Polyangiaceae bacterium]
MKIFSRLAGAHGALPLAFGAASLVLGACSQTPITVTLHSLQSSGKVSFVCQADDGAGVGFGLKLDECPDYEDQHRRILALVGQTATNEVALVDLRAGSVVDFDPSSPGYTFLRVGAAPGAIVSSPGGVASFVGVSGLLKNGVFALPTSCFEPPMAGQVARDLTSWSACALTSAPGDMTLLIDPPTLGDPANPGLRAACGSTALEVSPDPKQQPMGDAGAAAPTGDAGEAGATGDAGGVAAGVQRECPADLTVEGGPRGRRKLLVALPEENKLVLLDAQELLDRAPGEFAACNVEATYPLQAPLPSDTVSSVLPADLMGTPDPAICPVTQFPAITATAPTPAGMAVSNNQL